jgi:peptide/nickel transport system substrate-binding protein
MTKWLTFVAACWLIVTALISGPGAVSAQTLRIGLAEDPDMLDPTLSRTFVSYVVRTAL